MFLLALLAVVLLPYALFNVGGSIPEEAGTGTVLKAPSAAPAARPALKLTRIRPVTVRGTGFKPGERVSVRLEARRQAVTASRAGGFTVRFGQTATCAGGTIVAVGSRGSRAVANFAQLLCVEP
jgi:hypothetical protein